MEISFSAAGIFDVHFNGTHVTIDGVDSNELIEGLAKAFRDCDDWAISYALEIAHLLLVEDTIDESTAKLILDNMAMIAADVLSDALTPETRARLEKIQFNGTLFGEPATMAAGE